jgi:hypothetical protein
MQDATSLQQRFCMQSSHAPEKTPKHELAGPVVTPAMGPGVGGGGPKVGAHGAGSLDFRTS